MKIITGTISRNKSAEIAAARAQIAAHHFGCFTKFSPVFTRLLTGLRSRKIIREAEG